MSHNNEQIKTSLEALARVVYGGDSYESVYDAICATAVELIDGCDHASLMIRRNGRFGTAAASDDIARTIDQLELQQGSGPCVDAIEDEDSDVHLAVDLESSTKWPELVREILARTPVRGMGGLRVRNDNDRVSALNIFSDQAGALTGESLNQASLLAAFASVAIAAVDRGDEAATLRRGLQSNREIGKAIGLLMMMNNVNDDEAFAMLSKLSQDMNVKVAEVARRVIDHHNRTGSA